MHLIFVVDTSPSMGRPVPGVARISYLDHAKVRRSVSESSCPEGMLHASRFIHSRDSSSVRPSRSRDAAPPAATPRRRCVPTDVASRALRFWAAVAMVVACVLCGAAGGRGCWPSAGGCDARGRAARGWRRCFFGRRARGLGSHGRSVGLGALCLGGLLHAARARVPPLSRRPSSTSSRRARSAGKLRSPLCPVIKICYYREPRG